MKDYFLNFVISEGSKKLTNRLQVNTTGRLPAFQTKLDFCTDRGNLVPDVRYRNEITENADFLLIVGSFLDNSGVIAYASFCVLGMSVLFFLEINMWISSIKFI